MKIVIKYGTNRDGLDWDEMSVTTENDQERMIVHPLCECPEDAIIGRDLNSCYDTLKFIKMAYEAGKNGENLEIEEIEE